MTDEPEVPHEDHPTGGKVRDTMKVYSWVGGDRPSDIVEDMERLVQGGFDTFKLNGTEELAMVDTPRAIDAAVAKIAGVHEALGTRVSFGVIHASLNPPDGHNPAWRHDDGSIAEW